MPSFNENDIKTLQQTALFMRQKMIDISHYSNTSTHLGGGLSMADIMAVLYTHVMNIEPSNPQWEDRDRFILSKGHGVLGLYSALLAANIIDEETFSTFQQNGSDLIAHPVMKLDIGIESSNGSLGQGLSMAIGIAHAAKKKQQAFKVFTLVGDGETNEGSIWEGAMLAPHLVLDNLCVIVDYNRMQNDGAGKDIVRNDNMAEKFNAFGWHVIEIDGHDIEAILKAFYQPTNNNLPKAIIAHTIKGKGVSFMENDNAWHHNRLAKTNYDIAFAELNAVETN